ncbi:hypothetical protein BS47DRAFT_1395255 [Hydnum rufescens UP504]|uniref:DEK C-terminal domain-containing protein n=1 Tax=Hydnum rufescens UP504 TaxID=1448309 RepID=A0A9P6DQM6_9AGAM|nr:hypothetical protein BS47DRAFT_1395255 [Hydnum rufescens UP504]
MLPTDADLANATRSMVRSAIEGDTLHELSKAKIRSTLEKEFGLEEGTLKVKKRLLSNIVDETIAGKEEVSASASPKRKLAFSPPEHPLSPHKKIKASPEYSTKPISQSNATNLTENEKDVDQEKSESELSVLIDEPPKRRKSKASKKSSSKLVNEKAETELRKSGEKSESEMSVLIDKKPAKKRQSRNPKEKKPKENLTKNEEIIKKYKALVVACGVRKQWSKEFAGLDTEMQQISHLRCILSDLGMSGRMSMEQAKAIRQKRELKAEIEDVVRFERAKGVGGSRASRSQSSFSQTGSNEENDSDPPTKSKVTVARSILAFLGDQNESD